MYQRPDRWLSRAIKAAHRSARPPRPADFQGRKRIPAWQLGLAASVALVLLGTLLSLAPWPARHDAPLIIPQATLARGGDRTAEVARETVAPAGPGQVPEGETNRAGQEAQSPARMTQQSQASGEAPAQQPAADTQTMRESIPWPGTARRTHEEHLDTQAMDNLLARLSPADKPPLPTAPRAQVARKKEVRRLPRVSSAGRRTPDFVLSPQRSGPAGPGPWSRFRSFTSDPGDNSE